jgi:hypothetical protein
LLLRQHAVDLTERIAGRTAVRLRRLDDLPDFGCCELARSISACGLLVLDELSLPWW